MLWKSRTFWNVRATPSLVTAYRFLPLIRPPSNRISPSLGW